MGELAGFAGFAGFVPYARVKLSFQSRSVTVLESGLKATPQTTQTCITLPAARRHAPTPTAGVGSFSVFVMRPRPHQSFARGALVQNDAGRFTVLHRDPDGNWREVDLNRPVSNRIGWRKRDGGRDEFLIPPETWRAEICGPATLDPIATARTLAERGFLGRDGRNRTVNERLPGFGRMRVHAILAALPESPDATESAPEDATEVAARHSCGSCACHRPIGPSASNGDHSCRV